MDEKMTNAGIKVLGDVAWGTHLCQFYHDRQDLLGILVPYFRAGLENNELCVWMAEPPYEGEDVVDSLRESLENGPRYEGRGKLEIFQYEDYYLENGVFSPQKALDGAKEMIGRTLAGGYAGLRGACDASRVAANN